MRKKRLTRLTYVAGIILIGVLSLPRINVPAQKMTSTNMLQARVSIAKQEYSLLFEGPDLSPELKTMMADDIELVLADMEDVVFQEIKNLNIHSRTRNFQHAITHQLNLQEQKRWLPKMLQRDFGAAVKVDHGYQLVIHQTITKAYMEALEITKERPNILKQLDDFMSILQTPDERRSVALDSDKARSMFFFYRMESWDKDEVYRKNLMSDASNRMKQPSVLEFTTLGKLFKDDDELTDAPVFFAQVPLQEGKKEHLERWPPFVYVNGEWRILVAPLP